MTPINTSSVLMVGYNLRFHFCVKKAKEWLEEGLIGKPLWARFTCAQFNDKPDYLRDGVILNWSHELDLALYLLGGARVVAAAASGLEDTSDIILRHDNHCQSAVHLDYVTRLERRGFIIVGTDGCIDGDLVNRQVILRNNLADIKENLGGRDSWDGNYLDEAREFLYRLDNMKEQMVCMERRGIIGCTAEDSTQVVDICLQAKEYVRGS